MASVPRHDGQLFACSFVSKELFVILPTSVEDVMGRNDQLIAMQ
jgi:hypothetical protein